MCCKRCNMMKGDKDLDYFKERFPPFIVVRHEDFYKEDPQSIEEIKPWQKEFSKWCSRYDKTLA